MVELVCVGNPFLDILHSGSTTQQSPGGPEANTAAAYVQLGGTAGLLGRVGDDAEGRFLREHLVAAGVDCARLRVDGSPTYVLDVFVTPHERTFRVRERVNPKLECFSEDDVHYIVHSKATFLRLRSGLLPAILETVREAGWSLYLSAHNYRGPPENPAHDLRRAPVAAIVGDEEELEVVQRVCALPPQTCWVYTVGTRGSYAFSEAGRMEVPAFSVPARDPTGCGDAFAAGYVYGALRSWPMCDRLALGNACGALTVQGLGAQQPLPREALDRLLLDGV